MSVFRLIFRDIIVTKYKIVTNNNVWGGILHPSSQKWMDEGGQSSGGIKCGAKVCNSVIQ